MSLITQAYTKTSQKRSPKGKGPSKPGKSPRVVPRVNDSAYGAVAKAPNDPAYKKGHPTSRSGR